MSAVTSVYLNEKKQYVQ